MQPLPQVFMPQQQLMPQLQRQPPRQMLLHLPLREAPAAATAAGAAAEPGGTGGGSPGSLFSDGELDSVLLPPEVMATAVMPYEDDEEMSLGSLGR